MANMILRAATNKVGSECSCDMGITREEWDKMPSEEQNQYINEYMSNVVDVWVDEGEED